jgi:hypothetical protein
MILEIRGVFNQRADLKPAQSLGKEVTRSEDNFVLNVTFKQFSKKKVTDILFFDSGSSKIN